MSWLLKAIRPEQIREISLLILIVVAIVAFGSMIPGYYSPRTFNRIASSVMIVAVLGTGMTLVVLTRNIDLSVGSIVGCTAYFSGSEIAAHHDMPVLAGVLLAVALGTAMGLANGLLVAFGRVPSIIVTLGTLAIYRGILIQGSNAQTVTTSSLPAWVVDLPQKTLFKIDSIEIKVLVAVALVVVVVFHLATQYLNAFRRFYALGSNPDAAELVGLPARRIVLSAFLISGALAGLAGFMTLARFGNITVENGMGLELQVVAAVVVGAVNIFGGSGTVVGATLGAILIGILEQSLFRLQINQFWLDAVLGLLILLAVASDAVILQRLRALWTKPELKAAPTIPLADATAPAPLEHHVSP